MLYGKESNTRKTMDIFVSANTRAAGTTNNTAQKHPLLKQKATTMSRPIPQTLAIRLERAIHAA